MRLCQQWRHRIETIHTMNAVNMALTLRILNVLEGSTQGTPSVQIHLYVRCAKEKALRCLVSWSLCVRYQ